MLSKLRLYYQRGILLKIILALIVTGTFIYLYEDYPIVLLPLYILLYLLHKYNILNLNQVISSKNTKKIILVGLFLWYILIPLLLVATELKQLINHYSSITLALKSVLTVYYWFFIGSAFIQLLFIMLPLYIVRHYNKLKNYSHKYSTKEAASYIYGNIDKNLANKISINEIEAFIKLKKDPKILDQYITQNTITIEEYNNIFSLNQEYIKIISSQSS